MNQSESRLVWTLVPRGLAGDYEARWRGFSFFIEQAGVSEVAPGVRRRWYKWSVYPRGSSRLSGEAPLGGGGYGTTDSLSLEEAQNEAMTWLVAVIRGMEAQEK